MAPSQATSGMGTTLERNGTEIAEVTKIGGPSFEADEIEVTHLKSDDWWKEFIGSLKDGGELTFEGNLILSNPTHSAATGLLSAFTGTQAPPRDTWAVIFPEGTTFTLPGFLKKWETGAETNGKLPYKCTVRVAGKPTLA